MTDTEIPPGAHRYWRMKVLGWGNNGRHCTVANEVEFLTEDDEDMTLGAPGGPIGSTQDYGGTFQGAFNRDGAATIWHDNCDGNGWIGWQFGDNPLDWPTMPMKVAWTSSSDWTYGPQDSPTDLSIEWSDDGVTWTRAWRTLGMPAFGDNTRHVVSYVEPPPGAHRYWRIRGYTGNGLMRASEVEMRKSSGGFNLCAGGTAMADSAYSSAYAAAYAFNGTTGGNHWASSNWTSGNNWIGYDFGQPVEVNHIRYAPAEGQSFVMAVVESSDDALTWEAEWWITNHSWPGFVSFERPSFEDDAARYWALAGLVGNPNRDFIVGEIEMAATEGGPKHTGMTPYYFPSREAAANLIDGNVATYGYTNTNTEASYFRFDFGAGNEKVVREVRVARAAGANAMPRIVAVLRSHDGVNWQEMAREEYLWGDVWHSYLIEGDEPEPEPTLVRRRLIVVT